METREGKDDLRLRRTGEDLCSEKSKMMLASPRQALRNQWTQVYFGGKESKPRASRTKIGSTN